MRSTKNLKKLYRAAVYAGRNGYSIQHTDCTCNWLQKLVWELGYYEGLKQSLVAWLLERKKSNG